MLIAIAVAFSLLILLLISIAVISPAENYLDPEGPLYTGAYAGEPQQFDGSLKVVCWNLNFAAQVDQAIEEFERVEELNDADIILLQEMDEVGAEKLANDLEYNYVYYPAAIHRRHNRQFGNAILSKWVISEPLKIILPNSFSGLKHNRIAIRAMVDLGTHYLAVYSVHLDMVWMLPGQTDTQLDVLVSHVGAEDNTTVVGGDFNSWSRGSVAMLEKHFSDIGLLRVSQNAGTTLRTYGSLQLTTDHIFASHVSSHEAGAWHNSDISDHAAVWTILRFEEAK